MKGQGIYHKLCSAHLIANLSVTIKSENVSELWVENWYLWQRIVWLSDNTLIEIFTDMTHMTGYFRRNLIAW